MPDLILPGVLLLVVRLRGGGGGLLLSARLCIVPQHLLEFSCWLDICCKHFWDGTLAVLCRGSSPFTGSNNTYCFIHFEPFQTSIGARKKVFQLKFLQLKSQVF